MMLKIDTWNDVAAADGVWEYPEGQPYCLRVMGPKIQQANDSSR